MFIHLSQKCYIMFWNGGMILKKNANTFERKEKKIIINKSDFPAITEKIMEYLVPDKHNDGGKPYDICNVYFDNDRGDIIRNSVSKPKYKAKLRLRSYGTPSLDDNVFFEIKSKTNKVGTKRRAIMPLKKVYDFLDTGIIPEDESYINRQVLREISYFMETYDAKPKTYVSYRRYAFYSKDDPELRITFDTDIISRRNDLRLELGDYGEPLLDEDKMIIEIKFTGSIPLWFAHILSDFGLAIGSFSKIGHEFKKNLLTADEKGTHNV